jgi:hypothetical protein
MTDNPELQRITGTALTLTFMLDAYIKRHEQVPVIEAMTTAGEDDYIKRAYNLSEQVYDLLIKEEVAQKLENKTE